MMEVIGDENIYTFSRKEALFINIHVILHILTCWPLLWITIYMCIDYYNDCIQLFSNLGMLLICIVIGLWLYLSCKNFYYRWRLFKYNETTSLLINISQKNFKYKHNDIVVTFNSCEVEKWSWCEYKNDPYNTIVEVIDIELKNGEKVILSSGIGKNVLLFFFCNWEKLCLPKGEKRCKSLHTYMKEIISIDIARQND